MSISRKQDDNAEIDISQANILHKIVAYFRQEQRNADCSEDGYCCGFAVLAVYGMWVEFTTKANADQAGRDDYAWFERVLTAFSQWDENADSSSKQLSVELRYEIDRLYALVRYFQAPICFGSIQVETEKLLADTRNRVFVAEYSLTGFFSKNDLIKPIFLVDDTHCARSTNVIDVLINEDKMVMIYSKYHVTSVIKHQGRYFYYDANSPHGRLIFSGEQNVLAEHIFETHYPTETSGALSFRVLDDVVNPRCDYPPQAVLLRAIKLGTPQLHSFDKLHMHRAGLFQSAWAGCVLSASYHLQHLSDRKAVINDADKTGLSPLHYATAAGAVELVEMLLGCGAQVNQQNPHGMTPLHVAVTLSRVGVVQRLLAAGADPNLRSKTGIGPLYKAVYNNHTELTSILLQAGALPVGTPDASYMPLHCACEFGNLAIVELLVQYGAVIDEVNARGQTPLSLVLQRQHDAVAQYLRSHSAELPGHDGKRLCR